LTGTGRGRRNVVARMLWFSWDTGWGEEAKKGPVRGGVIGPTTRVRGAPKKKKKKTMIRNTGLSKEL